MLRREIEPADERFTKGWLRWRAARRHRDMALVEPEAASGLIRYAEHHQAIGVAMMVGNLTDAHRSTGGPVRVAMPPGWGSVTGGGMKG